jgi:lycopene beta-cyclase
VAKKTFNLHNHYNYIITGAGCAGSSLLMRMMHEPFFAAKKILVIDQSPKNTNDRTWCFWEKGIGIFEPIVHHQWNKLDFFSEVFTATLDIKSYQYKMIRAIDLYKHVRSESLKHDNIEWRYGKINRVDTIGNKAVVSMEEATFTADYIFNSISFRNITAAESGGKHFLLQHFKGWMIRTDKPQFDPLKATFMDFRVDQKHGTTFVYMLPTSSTEALVEYTLFSERVLPEDAYEKALQDYISQNLHIEQYRIIHEESGIIPMTNMYFPLQEGKVVNMGIVGGQAKASSGYAFQFIQKRTATIVGTLMEGGSSFSDRPFSDKKFHLYDSVLLNVLCGNKMEGAAIFAAIFKHNPADRVLRFLDNESSMGDDLQIMRSVPGKIFMRVAMWELFFG